MCVRACQELQACSILWRVWLYRSSITYLFMLKRQSSVSCQLLEVWSVTAEDATSSILYKPDVKSPQRALIGAFDAIDWLQGWLLPFSSTVRYFWMMLHRAPSRTLILKEWRYVPYIMCDSAVEVTLTVECRSLSLPQYGSAEFGFADPVILLGRVEGTGWHARNLFMIEVGRREEERLFLVQKLCKRFVSEMLVWYFVIDSHICTVKYSNLAHPWGSAGSYCATSSQKGLIQGACSGDGDDSGKSW